MNNGEKSQQKGLIKHIKKMFISSNSKTTVGRKSNNTACCHLKNQLTKKQKNVKKLKVREMK